MSSASVASFASAATIASLLLAACGGGHGSSPAGDTSPRGGGWVPVASEEGAFEGAFPVPPATRDHALVAEQPGGDGLHYEIAWAPAAPGDGFDPAVCDDDSRAYAGNAKAVVEARPVGRADLECRVTTDARVTVVRHVLVAARQRAYTLVVGAPRATFEPASAEEFFARFRPH